MNPYSQLDSVHFWKSSVARRAKFNFDPIINTKFKILKTDKVSSAGSCFAQHISKSLSEQGFNYFVTEDGQALPPEEKKERQFGVYSARYGNIYTSLQLLQLVEESLNNEERSGIVLRRDDGKFIDALRPRIEPNGHKDPDEVLKSRHSHLECVEKIFKETDVFIFTLGLTECWKSSVYDTVYPIHPGAIIQNIALKDYEFVNLSVFDVIEQMNSVLKHLKTLNPKIRVLLTVSPVPLIATYSGEHIAVANTYSKSTLRIACHEITRKHDWVDYLPSYEVITGLHAGSTYYENNLRSVTRPGVEHAMRIFFKHFTDFKQSNSGYSMPMGAAADDVVCEEELIVKPR